jgi:hypothetical protein
MEKECSLACIKKHMTIYKEVLKWRWREEICMWLKFFYSFAWLLLILITNTKMLRRKRNKRDNALI